MFKFFVNGSCWFFLLLLKHSFYGSCFSCYSPEKLEAGVSMQPGNGVAYLHKAITSKWRFQVRQMCIDYSDLYLCQTLYLYMPYIYIYSTYILYYIIPYTLLIYSTCIYCIYICAYMYIYIYIHKDSSKDLWEKWMANRSSQEIISWHDTTILLWIWIFPQYKQ